MVVRPNKPVLFAVYHLEKNVSEAIEQFRQEIKGKKQLFIEMKQEYVDQILKKGKYHDSQLVRAYQRLVVEAHNAGLRIVPLDKEKYWRDLLRLVEMEQALRKRFSGREPTIYEIRELEKIKNRMLYSQYNKREKMWLEKLRRANSTSIVVMTENHAVEIAKKLKLPDGNIVFPGAEKLREMTRADWAKREISRETAEEIGAARLERARRRAEQRAIRKARQTRRARP